MAIDANQRWNVGEAIEWVKALAEFDVYWIEEPTSPDDVLGHAAIRAAVAPVKVATGEHVQNRIVFKQLLQAERDRRSSSWTRRASAGSTRTWRSCCWRPSSGCRCARTPAASACASWCSTCRCSTSWRCQGSREDRVVEYVDHLHEHFVTPTVVAGGAYQAPTVPGFCAEMFPATLEAYAFPDGSFWRADRGEV